MRNRDCVHVQTVGPSVSVMPIWRGRVDAIRRVCRRSDHVADVVVHLKGAATQHRLGDARLHVHLDEPANVEMAPFNRTWVDGDDELRLTVEDETLEMWARVHAFIRLSLWRLRSRSCEARALRRLLRGGHLRAAACAEQRCCRHRGV